MTHSQFLIEKNIWKASCFYDSRSDRLAEIEEFLVSDIFKNIEKNLEKETYISLWGGLTFCFYCKIGSPKIKADFMNKFLKFMIFGSRKRYFSKRENRICSKKISYFKGNYKIW